MPRVVKGEKLMKLLQVRANVEDLREIQGTIADIKEMLPLVRKYPDADFPYAISSDIIRMALVSYKAQVEAFLTEKEAKLKAAGLDGVEQ